MNPAAPPPPDTSPEGDGAAHGGRDSVGGGTPSTPSTPSTPRMLTDTERMELTGQRDDSPVAWVWRIMIGAAVLGLLAIWTYALWGPRSDPPGTMDDPAFGAAAEQVCAPVLEQVQALPFAHETPDPLVRADVIDEANELLAGQLDALNPLIGLTEPGSEDRRRASEWLADWETHLDERRAYPPALRADRNARFTETEKGGRGISTALDEFARKNVMLSCATPGDVG